ncbi:hypothetical protein Tco_0574122 [Tanacetum coccineum]
MCQGATPIVDNRRDIRKFNKWSNNDVQVCLAMAATYSFVLRRRGSHESFLTRRFSLATSLAKLPVKVGTGRLMVYCIYKMKIQNLKLKEMGVALLSEMNVGVSDEDIEAIVDKWLSQVGHGNADLQLIFSTSECCIPNLTGLYDGGIVADSKCLTWSCDTVRNEKAAENRPSSSASLEGEYFCCHTNH